MFDNVKVVGVARPVQSGEVDAAEKALGVSFPDGYREYVQKFGRGSLGHYVRIYAPADIVRGGNSVAEWRKRIDEYWFWDSGPLKKEKALECIIIGDTFDGDELVFHPSDRNRLYVLPRNEEKSFVAGTGLIQAIEWLCGSGVLTEAISQRDFEPFDD
jgi:hypothetical protein